MVRFRKSLIIFGCIILCAIGALVAFFTLSAGGAVVTDPIELTIFVADNLKEYDGTPLEPENYTLVSGELLKDHRISVTYEGSQTEVGTSEGSLSAKILDKKNRDVSSNYIIRVENGELEVVQRFISVGQREVVREYTGKSVEGGDYFMKAGTTLCSGHRLVCTEESGVVDVGPQYDLTVPQIFDALGNDVTQNYDMDYTPGIIYVERRAIEIEPVGATKVYDGTKLYPDYRITYGSLLSGHKLTVTYKPKNSNSGNENFGLTEPGTVEFEIANYIIVDEDNNNMTDNYDITPSVMSATLRIDRRDLTVEGASGSWIYDGNTHSTKDKTAPENDASVDLCLDDTIKITYTVEATDVSSSGPNKFDVEITNKDGQDVTNCYRIDRKFGNLEITPRKVGIELKSIGDKTYDGRAVDMSGLTGKYVYYDENGDEDSSLDAAALDGELNGALIPVMYYNGSQIKPENVKNAGTYSYSITLKSNNFVIANEDDLSQLFTIKPRRLDIETNDISIVYSAAQCKFEVEELISNLDMIIVVTPEDMLGAGDDWLDKFTALNQEAVASLYAKINGEIKDVGTYFYTVETSSSNFETAPNIVAKVQVVPREVTVKFSDAIEDRQTYNGEAISTEGMISAPEFKSEGAEDKFSYDDLLKEFNSVRQIVAYYNGSQILLNMAKNAGTYLYTVTLSSNNFKFGDGSVLEKVIVIGAAEIDIGLKTNLDRTYTGSIQPYTVDDIVDSVIVADNIREEAKNSLKLNFSSSIILNAGLYRFAVETLSSNFELKNIVEGSFEITPLKVTLALKGGVQTSRYYDGLALGDRINDFTYNLSGALKDEFKSALQGIMYYNGSSVSPSAAKNAGVYTYSLMLTSNNFTLDADGVLSQDYVINQRIIGINWDDFHNKPYDGSSVLDGEIRYTVKDGAVLTDTVNSEIRSALQFTIYYNGIQILPSQAVNAGTYLCSASLASANFSIEGLSSKTVTISQKNIAITLKSNISRTYGGCTPELAITDFIANYNGLNADEKAALWVDYPLNAINVGTYRFTVGTNNSNYTVEITSGTFTITPLAVTVPLRNINAIREYDKNTVGDLKNGDPDFDLPNGADRQRLVSEIQSALQTVMYYNGTPILPSEAKNAGTYSYVVTLNSSNFTLTGASVKNFTITPKEVTAMFTTTIERDYNGCIQTVEINDIAVGLDSEIQESFWVNCSLNAKDVGSYPFTFGIGSSNYIIKSNTSGTLTINPLKVTAVLKNLDYEQKPYDGDAIGELLVGSDFNPPDGADEERLLNELGIVLQGTMYYNGNPILPDKAKNVGKYSYVVSLSSNNFVLINDEDELRIEIEILPKELNNIRFKKYNDKYTGEIKTIGVSDVVDLSSVEDEEAANSLSIRFTGVIKNAGTYPFTLEINNPNYILGANVITEANKNPVIITPIDITRIAYSGVTKKEYNGEPLAVDYSLFTVTPELPPMDVHVVGGFATFGDAGAGDKQLKIYSLTLRNDSDEDVSQNYRLPDGYRLVDAEGNDLTCKIEKCKIEIYGKTDRMTAVQYGSVSGSDAFDEYCKGLLSDSALSSPALKFVGHEEERSGSTVYVKLKLEISADYADNYKIVGDGVEYTEDGYITVTAVIMLTM